MFSSLPSCCFLKDTLLISHSLQIYDIVLYLYTLLINHLCYDYYDPYFMFYRLEYMLGFISLLTQIYCVLHSPHVLSVSIMEASSCVSHFFLIVFSRIPYIFLMVIRYIQQQTQTCILILYQLIISFILSQVFA